MTLDDAKKPDAELLRQTLAGEDEAFHHLVARYSADVYALIRGITHDPAATDLLWPQAFSAAHRHLDRFDLSRSFRPWLLKLAADLAFHRRRRQSLAPHAAPATGLIHRTPPLSLAVLTLRSAFGLRYEEIAETLGIPPETILNLLRQTRPPSGSGAAASPEEPVGLADGATCASVRYWLDAFVDRQLSRHDHRAVERHLARCGDCHEEWESIQALRLAVSAEAQAAAPDAAHLGRLQAQFRQEGNLPQSRLRWRGAFAAAPHRPLPFGMESWPQLALGLLTVIAVGVLVCVAQNRRATLPELSRGTEAPGSPNLQPLPPPTAGRDSFDPLLVWSRGLVELIATQAPVAEPPRAPDGRTPSDALSGRGGAWLRAHERDDAFPDSLWARGWHDEARRRADRAIVASDSTAGREALASYYRVVSRAGRMLLPDPSAQAQALAPDRPRIEALLRLVSR